MESIEKNFNQVLDLQGSIQALIDKTGNDSFNNLVNEICLKRYL